MGAVKLKTPRFVAANSGGCVVISLSYSCLPQNAQQCAPVGSFQDPCVKSVSPEAIMPGFQLKVVAVA